MNNNKGFALLTTLILSGIALAFIAGLIYMSKAGIDSTTSLKTYKSSLAVGKGASDYLIASVHNEDITPTTLLSVVQSLINDNYGAETPGYTITVLDYTAESFDDGSKEVYTFKVQVIKNDTKEKTIIEFGYLVES